jgi:hypothetical protein
VKALSIVTAKLERRIKQKIKNKYTTTDLNVTDKFITMSGSL